LTSTGAPHKYRQRALFEPHGLAGHLYWRTIAPFHGIVFGGMVRNIPGVAERHAGRASGPAVHVMPEGEQ
jgi:hypothetical protein